MYSYVYNYVTETHQEKHTDFFVFTKENRSSFWKTHKKSTANDPRYEDIVFPNRQNYTRNKANTPIKQINCNKTSDDRFQRFLEEALDDEDDSAFNILAYCNCTL